MKGGKVFRFSQRAKLEDLVRIVAEREVPAEGLEEIARDISRFGDNAVGPLLTALENTVDEHAFYRITYVIECLQNSEFVESLLRILLTKELPSTLRGQILNVLGNYDVDISDSILGAIPGKLQDLTESFVNLTIRDENLLESFLEEFQHLEVDLKKEIVDRIASIRSKRSVFILFVIASMTLDQVAGYAAKALGKVRDGMALAALERLGERTRDGEVRKQVLRSTRKLHLAGVSRKKRFFRFPEGPFYHVYVSRIDGLGEFSINFSRFYDDRKRSLAMSVFQVHEGRGITECFGHLKISTRSFDHNMSSLIKARISLEVPYEYGVRLLRHGMYLTERWGGLYPPEMSLREQMLAPDELSPEPHRVEIKSCDSEKEIDNLSLLERTGRLISIPECSDWFISSRKTFEFAEKYDSCGGFREENHEGPRPVRILSGFIRECLWPMRDTIKERLLFAAEVMERGGRPRKYIRSALCAALNIGKEGNVNFARHPFILSLARESLREASEYMREGGDYTAFFDDYGDEG